MFTPSSPRSSGQTPSRPSRRAVAADHAAVRPSIEQLEGRRLLSAVNGAILFESTRDGNSDLYSMNPDGSGVTRLTNDPAADQFAAWSPDGTKVAFSSNRDDPGFEIYTMNADGSNVTRLTNSPRIDFDPSWSPDGSKIAFESGRDGGLREIYTMNADGTNQMRVTFNASSDVRAAWSPDGSRIAFVSDRDGNNEIYVMNADGSGQIRLTSDQAFDGAPKWSPDSTKLTFFGARDGNTDVFTMNADGTGLTRLTSDAGIDGSPAWSPDGQKIAFVSNRDGNFEIYRMNGDGSEQTRLTVNAAFEGGPDWAIANQPPTAVDDTASTVSNVAVTIAVLNNDSDDDGDTLQVVGITQPADGAVVINPDKTVTYTPNASFSGPDAFTYMISDGRGGQDTATVTVSVLAPVQVIENVIAQIDSMHGVVLSHGDATNLIAKLHTAITQLDRDSATQAVQLLEVFLDRAGILPQPEQQQIIDDILAVIESLEQAV